MSPLTKQQCACGEPDKRGTHGPTICEHYPGVGGHMLTSNEKTDPREWLIRKRGYYYRPNRSGYTASVDEAGRYTETEAKTEAAIEPWHMAAVHQSAVEPIHSFKNFHRQLCERFGYAHDEVDWQRDQVSLIEHIAKRLSGDSSAHETEARQERRIDVDGLDELLAHLDPGACECRECPECDRMPADCSGTECARTCQCSECDHCRIQQARDCLKSAQETGPDAMSRRHDKLMADIGYSPDKASGPKPDAEKAPVISADPCPTGDWVHEEHNGKCVYCGAPMSSQSNGKAEHAKK